MKTIKALVLLCVVSFLTTSCFKDNDDNQISANEINDFVWKGMNLYYLWQSDVPDLADDRFENQSQLNTF